MKYDCCKTICEKPENENTDYCKKLCVKTPPPTPPSSCATITDPQEKYCCEYPGMPFCDTYKETDPNYDPSDPTPSKEKKGICDKDDDEVIKFKYPAKGYGQKVLENEACSVSCQEIQDITFQKMPTLRAEWVLSTR